MPPALQVRVGGNEEIGTGSLFFVLKPGAVKVMVGCAVAGTSEGDAIFVSVDGVLARRTVLVRRRVLWHKLDLFRVWRDGADVLDQGSEGGRI